MFLPSELRDHPGLAAVARDEELASAEEQRARVVRREPNRRVPVELLNRAGFGRVEHVAATAPSALATAGLRWCAARWRTARRRAGATGRRLRLTAAAGATAATTGAATAPAAAR